MECHSITSAIARRALATTVPRSFQVVVLISVDKAWAGGSRHCISMGPDENTPRNSTAGPLFFRMPNRQSPVSVMIGLCWRSTPHLPKAMSQRGTSFHLVGGVSLRTRQLHATRSSCQICTTKLAPAIAGLHRRSPIAQKPCLKECCAALLLILKLTYAAGPALVPRSCVTLVSEILSAYCSLTAAWDAGPESTRRFVCWCSFKL